MNAPNRLENKSGSQEKITPKLMVNGFVCPDSGCALSIEIRRGMVIRSKEGREVGKVAAVVLDGETHKATHIILSRLPEINGYWSVPVNVIAGVRDEDVQLSIPSATIEAIPQWHST